MSAASSFSRLAACMQAMLKCAPAVEFIKRGLNSEEARIRNGKQALELIAQAKDLANETRPLTRDEQNEVVNAAFEKAGIRLNSGAASRSRTTVTEVLKKIPELPAPLSLGEPPQLPGTASQATEVTE